MYEGKLKNIHIRKLQVQNEYNFVCDFDRICQVLIKNAFGFCLFIISITLSCL